MSQLKNYKKIFVRLSVLALILFGLQMAVDNPYSHSLIRLFLSKKLAEKGPIRFDFKALQISLIPLEIELFGLRVYLKGAEEESLITASRGQAQVSLWSLLISNPRFSSLELVDLNFHWPPSENLKSLIDKWQATPSIGPDSSKNESFAPIDLDFGIDKILVKNLRASAGFAMQTAEGPKVLEVLSDNISAEIISRPGSRLWSEFTVENLNLSVENRPVLTEAKLRLKLALRSNSLILGDFTFSERKIDYLGLINSDLDWSRGFLPDHLPVITTRIESQGKLDLSDLGALLDWDNTNGIVDYDAKTEILFDPNLEGDKFNFKSVGKVLSHDGEIEGFKLYESLANLTIDANHIAFSKGAVVHGGSNFGDFSGKVTFDDPVSFDFDAKLRGLENLTLFKAIKIDSDFLTGRLFTDDLRIYGTGEPFKLKVTANTTLANAKLSEDISLKPVFPKIVDKSFQTNCFANLAITVTETGVKLEDIPLACSLGTQNKTISSEEIQSGRRLLDGQPWILKGTLGFDRSPNADVILQMRPVDLKNIQGLLDHRLGGTGSLDLSFKGPYDDLSIQSEFMLKNARLGMLPFSSLQGVSSLNKDSFILKNFHASEAEQGKINIARMDFEFKKRRLQIDARGTDLKKAWLQTYFDLNDSPLPPFGLRSFQSNITLPLDKPLQFTGPLEFRIEELEYGDMEVLSEAEGKLLGSKNQFLIEELAIRFGGICLAGNGDIGRNRGSRDAKTDLGLFLTNLGLDAQSEIKIALNSSFSHPICSSKKQVEWDKLPILNKYSLPPTSSFLNAKLDVGGFVDDPRAVFLLENEEVRFNGQSTPNLNFKGEYFGLSAKVSVSEPAKSVGITADFDFSKNSYSAEVFARQFDMRPFLYDKGASRREGKVVLSFDSQWTAPIETPLLIDGEVNFGELSATIFSGKSSARAISKLALISPHRWVFSNGDLKKSEPSGPALFLGSGSELSFEIDKDFNFEKNLGTHLSGQIDLSLLNGAISIIDTISGQLSLDMRSYGPISDPQFQIKVENSKARISGSKIVVGLKDFKPVLDDVQFKAKIDSKSAVLESFKADKGRGTVTANGLFVFDENSGQTSRVQIAIDQAAVTYPLPLLRFIDTNLSGDLVISGKKAPYQITGDIVINRGRATRNFDVREEIVNSLRRQEINSLTVGGFGDVLFEYDIGLRADSSIQIRNQNVSAVLSADLRFTGPDRDPQILGEMAIKDGKFIYKREFKITQGVLTFDETSRSDPAIDLVGVSEINGYRVFVALTGRASSPTVDLSIDPPSRPDGRVLTKIDIIVLLSTGGLPEKQDDRVSFQGVATSEALNILAGQFEQPLEKIMNLSGQSLVREVYIDTYSDPSKDGRPTARLNFPINLHQDWDVLFRVDGNENWRVSLGYDLNDAINVSGNYDRQKESNTSSSDEKEKIDTGVDMRFQFSFP